MGPELGHLALIIAFGFSALLAILPLLGTWTHRFAWIQLARPLSWGQCFFVSISVIFLIHAFLSNDFSVNYVANHSNTKLPWWYRISAMWGAHEGSMLLWVLILSGWTLVVSLYSKHLPQYLHARTLSVLGIISFGFLLFLLSTSNPFLRFLPYPPPEGADLNPLLQDIGLIIHPPMLYMGYVGFSVPFAFIVALLLGGTLPQQWTHWIRPWALIAWLFLTIGIVLGSWWAYYELGWGGWWFWDPVENASFMPWLLGTAFLHSLAITGKRGLFASWTLLLGLFAFALSLLGAFLVRSGILSSVHAFANDPDRGIFILVFLCLIISTSLILYALKAPIFNNSKKFHWLSLETILLLNNLLLCTACFTVLLGTLFPLIIEALGLGLISVGPPYFNTMFIPIALITALLLGTGVLAHWKKTTLTFLWQQWKPMLLFAACITTGLLGLAGTWPTTITLLAVMCSSWIIAAIIQDLHNRMRCYSTIKNGLKHIRGSTWGMHTAHLGVALSLCGIALSSQLSLEKEIKLSPGLQTHIGHYHFRLEKIQDINGSNYIATQAVINVWKDRKHVTTLYPERRYYKVRDIVMTETAIDPGLTRDLYIALGEHLPDNSWKFRIQIKPFVRWIWLGGLIMALGSALAALDRRHRKYPYTRKNNFALQSASRE